MDDQLLGFSIKARFYVNRAALCKFYCIFHQVYEHLLEPALISDQHGQPLDGIGRLFGLVAVAIVEALVMDLEILMKLPGWRPQMLFVF